VGLCECRSGPSQISQAESVWLSNAREQGDSTLRPPLPSLLSKALVAVSREFNQCVVVCSSLSEREAVAPQTAWRPSGPLSRVVDAHFVSFERFSCQHFMTSLSKTRPHQHSPRDRNGSRAASTRFWSNSSVLGSGADLDEVPEVAMRGLAAEYGRLRGRRRGSGC
jgi:hypothetical protein